MECPKCGAENRAGAKFCHRCGELLSPTPMSDAVDKVVALPIVRDQFTPSIRSDANPTIASLEQHVQTTDEPAMPAATTSVADESSLTPLVEGTTLQDRYTILAVVRADADAIVYRVRDALRCPDPNCGAENSSEDKFCCNCGRELTERGTCLLEERLAPVGMSIASPAFVVRERIYTVRAEAPVTEESKPFPWGVHLTFGCKSDVGLTRGALGERDEDSVFALALSALHESVAAPTVGLFIVADGIGGSEAGEVASKKCVQVVVGELMRTLVLPVLAGETIGDEFVRECIQAAILRANVEVFQLAQEKQNEMGTTITLALVLNDNAYIANVGDSRTYIFTDGRLQQVTRDHSLVARLIATGQAQPEEIYTHPQRNLIFRSLGAKPEVEIDIFPEDGGALKLKPGARLLLCCDGLWEMVRDDEIEEHLLLEPDPQKVCNKLVVRANEAGGEDNVSVVVVNVA